MIKQRQLLVGCRAPRLRSPAAPGGWVTPVTRWHESRSMSASRLPRPRRRSPARRLRDGCSAGSPSLLPSLPALSTPPTADQIMQQLGAKVPSAKLGIVYAAEIDPNHLLGRPNGYSSKVSFTDSRADKKLLGGSGRTRSTPVARSRCTRTPTAQHGAPSTSRTYKRRRRSSATSTHKSRGQCWCACPGSSHPHRQTSTRPRSTSRRRVHAGALMDHLRS